MTTQRPVPPDDEPHWFVGFDWGSEKHRVALFDRLGKLIERRDVAHSATAYAELGDWLLRTTGAAPAEIAVAIETTHGPVVDALIDRGFPMRCIIGRGWLWCVTRRASSATPLCVPADAAMAGRCAVWPTGC